MSSQEDTVVCPLCQTRVSRVGGGDALQLHYLTQCSGYDKVSNESPRPKPTTQTGSSSMAYSNTMSGTAGLSAGTADIGASFRTPRSEASAAGGGSTLGEPAVGGDDGQESTSSVQFMWQPLSDINYPSITLLASFKGGSVDLKIDPDGGHYASQFISIPKGTYEGQLVIGDSFMHPVKKFTIEKDNDIVVLQFEVAGPGSRSSGDLDGGYGGHYGSGYMQKNPSYSQSSTHGSSYSYQNPAFGHGTSSRQQRSFTEEGSTYSAYGQPTLDTASESPYGNSRYSKVSPAPSSSNVNSRSAESQFSNTANVSQGREVTNDINISLGSTATGHSGGTEGAGRAKDKDSGFNVRRLQQERSEGGGGSQQLHELQTRLDSMIQEKNDLLQSQERVNAQWEGRIRRLERQLSAYQKGEKPDESDVEASLRDARTTIADLERQVAALRKQKSEDLQSARDSKDLRKQLDEMKDRNTALEQQMMEYTTTIQDQTKVIQGLKGSGGGPGEAALMQQLHKQQIEYSEALNSLQKKVNYADKVAQENTETHQMNVKLTGELEDYRRQTKRLIYDIQQKDEEMVAMKQALAQRPSGNNEAISLELATMKQKLMAWQEEAEKISPLQDRVEQLQTELARVRTANDDLQQQIQQLEADVAKSQRELSKKVADYNTLNERFVELQETRVTLENELQPLRKERASILRENAHLLEGSDPKKYAELKNKHEELEAHCKQLEHALEEQSSILSIHQESNVEMQQQLDKATDPERLQSIRLRMERYKQERDAARSRLEDVEKLLKSYQSEQEKLMGQLQEVSDQSERRLLELQQQMTQQEKSLLKSADYESRMRRYRDERNEAYRDNLALKQQISTLEGAISDLLAQTGRHDTMDYLQSLTGDFESMDVSAEVKQTVEQEPQQKDTEPASPTLDGYQPHQYSTDEDQHEYGAHIEQDNYQSPLDQEPRVPPERVKPDGDESQGLRTKGSLERTKTSVKTVEVLTKEGVVHMKIRKPDGPLNTKDKPMVIVKKTHDYEAGVLHYVGNLGGKELAGVQMSIKQSRTTGSGGPTLTDGTYRDGKRYFRCPVGHGLYVPLSKVFIKDDVI